MTYNQETPRLYDIRSLGFIFKGDQLMGQPLWFAEMVCGGQSEIGADQFLDRTNELLKDPKVVEDLEFTVFQLNVWSAYYGKAQLNWKVTGKRLGPAAKAMSAWIDQQNAEQFRNMTQPIFVDGIGELLPGDVIFQKGQTEGTYDHHSWAISDRALQNQWAGR